MPQTLEQIQAEEASTRARVAAMRKAMEGTGLTSINSSVADVTPDNTNGINRAALAWIDYVGGDSRQLRSKDFANLGLAPQAASAAGPLRDDRNYWQEGFGKAGIAPPANKPAVSPGYGSPAMRAEFERYLDQTYGADRYAMRAPNDGMVHTMEMPDYGGTADYWPDGSPRFTADQGLNNRYRTGRFVAGENVLPAHPNGGFSGVGAPLAWNKQSNPFSFSGSNRTQQEAVRPYQQAFRKNIQAWQQQQMQPQSGFVTGGSSQPVSQTSAGSSTTVRM